MRRAFPWSRKKTDPGTPDSLRGRRVILRGKRIEDAPSDYAWRTDGELARLDATRPLDMSFESYLRYATEELEFTSPWSLRFAIVTHEGKHIGNCMCYDIDHRKGEAELGIVVGDREYHGKGYGTDAVVTLLEHVWSTTELKRIYLHTLEWNHRARKSFAKSGFREVKNVRRSGLDFVRMELSRQEWEELEAKRARDGDQPAGREVSEPLVPEANDEGEQE